MFDNFDKYVDRTNISIKYGNKGKQYPGFSVREDAIPMWIADMDFACCEPVVKALYRTADQGTFGYEDPAGDRYRAALCAWMKKRHDWEIRPEWITQAPGAIEALDKAIEAFTEEGDGVIIQMPAYGPFAASVKTLGRRVAENNLILDENGFHLDFEDLERKAAVPENKMMIFCSSHNPTGRVWTKEELERICRICRENGVLIYSDEVHHDIVRPGFRHIPIAVFDPENVLTAVTAGKSFNLSGLHLASLIISDEEKRARFLEKRGKWFPDPFSAAAAVAAYEEGETWEDEVNQYLDESLTILEKALPEVMPKARLAAVEGTYLAWIDLRGYGKTQEGLSRMLVEEAGVIPNPGTQFGKAGEGFIRLNVACPHAVLREALARLKQVFG